MTTDDVPDPEDSATLQTIFGLREAATQKLLADFPAEGLAHAKEALDLSNRLKSREHVPPLLKEAFAPLLYRLGHELAQKHQLDDAICALESVASIEHHVDDLAAEASVLSDIATLTLNAGRAEEAIRLYETRVLPLRESIGDQAGARRVLRNIALAYFRLRERERCYDFLERSMAVGSVAEGLQTALALSKEGFDIPPSVLQRLRVLARDAGLHELAHALDALAGVEARTGPFRPTRIFLSYGHEDRAIVMRTYEFLRSSTTMLDVFLDAERLYAGWEWESVLLTHLREADVFVLFVGQHTLERPYVRKELETFLTEKGDERDRRVIPVFLPDCVDIPMEIASYQGVDLRQEDRGQQLRQLAQMVHDRMYVPAAELTGMTNRESVQSGDQTQSPNLQERWDAGEVGIDPRALRQLVNRRIGIHAFMCGHREYDPATDGARGCGAPAVAVCAACGKGACGHAVHVYGRFCTLLPPGTPFTRGNKLFYWCARCVGPLCTHCLAIEDDYPCSPDEVLSYRFHCPSCAAVVTIVPLLDVDYEAASARLLAWTLAGGPPGAGGSGSSA